MLEREDISSVSEEPRFRLDAPTHESLMYGPKQKKLLPKSTPFTLPKPVFPQHPEKLGHVEPDPKYVPSDGKPYRKRDCRPHCFSTLNHNLSYCYQASRAIKLTLKQAIRGFRGTTGSFED